MKTQMKFQKRLCMALLILGALSIVYALIYSTGVLAGFGTTLDVSGTRGYVPNTSFESGGQLYLDVQSFNNLLFYLGIVMLLAAVVLYITACNKRRNYYISNYVASIAVAAIFVIISLVLLIMNGIYLGKTLDILNDESAMAAYLALSEDLSTLGTIVYSENTAMFYIGFILYFLNIVGGAALIVNLIWKMKLMKGEKALLAQGFAKEVA